MSYLPTSPLQWEKPTDRNDGASRWQKEHKLREEAMFRTPTGKKELNYAPIEPEHAISPWVLKLIGGLLLSLLILSITHESILGIVIMFVPFLIKVRKDKEK